MKRLIAIGLLAGMATISGCIAIGGSDRCESRRPTLGRELQDLRVARDTGAISQEDYEKTKAALLASAQNR